MTYKNILKTEEEKAIVREGARISTTILSALRDAAKPGTTPKEINTLAEQLCLKNNVIPAFKGVPGPKTDFDGAICISVNDAVLHGLPFSEVPFIDGDIVKLDFGIKYKEYLTDHCITVGIGNLSDEEKRLINTAKLCIDTAVKKATSKNTVGDISDAMESICDMANLEYITSYCGHGIGKELWLNPQIPSYGDRGDGPKLVEGMVICVENQVSLGTADLEMDDDGWTLRTTDGSKTAMFEHMVMVGKDHVEVLTKMD